MITIVLPAVAVVLAFLAPAGECPAQDEPCAARPQVQCELLMRSIARREVRVECTLFALPTFLHSAESTQLTVVEGSPLELQCVGGFNLDWVFDGEFLNFSGGSSCGGYCSLSHNSLVFRAVLRQHQGGYACVPATVTYNVVVIG